MGLLPKSNLAKKVLSASCSEEIGAHHPQRIAKRTLEANSTRKGSAPSTNTKHAIKKDCSIVQSRNQSYRPNSASLTRLTGGLGFYQMPKLGTIRIWVDWSCCSLAHLGQDSPAAWLSRGVHPTTLALGRRPVPPVPSANSFPSEAASKAQAVSMVAWVDAGKHQPVQNASVD